MKLLETKIRKTYIKQTFSAVVEDLNSLIETFELKKEGIIVGDSDNPIVTTYSNNDDSIIVRYYTLKGEIKIYTFIE